MEIKDSKVLPEPLDHREAKELQGLKEDKDSKVLLE